MAPEFYLETMLGCNMAWHCVPVLSTCESDRNEHSMITEPITGYVLDMMACNVRV